MYEYKMFDGKKVIMIISLNSTLREKGHKKEN